MGNTIGSGRRKAKIMKITGETFKVKTPIRAWDVVKDYPGHVLMNSEAVKQFGVRAKPLEPQQDLKPKKIYFLVQLPEFPREEEKKVPRRVRSGIQVSAKDRLECLMLSRRSVSDLTSVRAASGSEGPVRMKMRLPRAEMVKLVEESKDDVEVAERIIEMYLANNGGKVAEGMVVESQEEGGLQRKPGLGRREEDVKPRHQKRVSFVPVEEGEIRLDLGPQ